MPIPDANSFKVLHSRSFGMPDSMVTVFRSSFISITPYTLTICIRGRFAILILLSREILMKILVFSDSHGAPAYIRTALLQHDGQADAVVFLGDGVLDAAAVWEEYPDIPAYMVRGNCDSALRLIANGIDAPEEDVITLGGLRFLILHGHTSGAKSGYGQMLLLAEKHRADGVLFGHTHMPESRSVPAPGDPDRRIFLFNPGSVGMSKDHSYGVIHIVDGLISAGHGSAIG